MTPGQLVKAVAIALDIPEETVVQHDRNLAVAGLRTSGGRGRSAPTVTHRDAARLVASILGSVKLRESAAVVQQLERTKVYSGKDGYTPLPLPRFAELPETHGFIDALTALIEEADTPQMFEDFPEFARRLSPLWVGNRHLGGYIFYFPEPGIKRPIDILYRGAVSPRSADEPADPWNWSNYLGLEQERKIRGNCLMILGLCFQKGLPASREAAFRAWKTASKKAA